MYFLKPQRGKYAGGTDGFRVQRSGVQGLGLRSSSFRLRPLGYAATRRSHKQRFKVPTFISRPGVIGR